MILKTVLVRLKRYLGNKKFVFIKPIKDINKKHFEFFQSKNKKINGKNDGFEN